MRSTRKQSKQPSFMPGDLLEMHRSSFAAIYITLILIIEIAHKLAVTLLHIHAHTHTCAVSSKLPVYLYGITN